MKRFATYAIDCLGNLDRYLGTYLANDQDDASSKVLNDNPGLTLTDIRVTRIY